MTQMPKMGFYLQNSRCMFNHQNHKLKKKNTGTRNESLNSENTNKLWIHTCSFLFEKNLNFQILTKYFRQSVYLLLISLSFKSSHRLSPTSQPLWPETLDECKYDKYNLSWPWSVWPGGDVTCYLYFVLPHQTGMDGSSFYPKHCKAFEQLSACFSQQTPGKLSESMWSAFAVSGHKSMEKNWNGH